MTAGTEDGQIEFFTAANSVFTSTAWFTSGKVYNAANSPDWDVASDEVLKRDVVPVSNALVSLGLLEPIKFQFNEKYREINPTADLSRSHTGLTAQNFARVFPEQVSDVGKYKNMNTGGLDALLVAGVQELDGYRLVADAEREAIRTEITGLQEKLHQMERRG